jgi:hypothetical protein
MVWTLEALEVHYFSIRLTSRRNFEIKHRFTVNTMQKNKHSATAKPYVNLTGS